MEYSTSIYISMQIYLFSCNRVFVYQENQLLS